MPKGTFVKPGEIMSARWANTLVTDIRENALGVDQRSDYMQYGFVPSFTPLSQRYVSGVWYTTLQPGYVFEYRTTEGATDGFAKLPIYYQSGEGGSFTPMDSYPTITLVKNQTLCVVYETDTYARGSILTSQSGTGAYTGTQEPYPQLQWFNGIGSGLDTILTDENTATIPENNDSEVLREDPAERDGRYVIPILSASGLTGSGGVDNGMKIIPLNFNNLTHKGEWKFSHRDAYNTGEALQALVVSGNDQQSSQEQGEPFYFRTFTGQASGYNMEPAENKATFLQQYAGFPETGSQEDPDATIISGSILLNDISGKLSFTNCTGGEVASLEWTNGMVDTEDLQTIQLGECLNGDDLNLTVIDESYDLKTISGVSSLVQWLSTTTGPTYYWRNGLYIGTTDPADGLGTNETVDRWTYGG